MSGKKISFLDVYCQTEMNKLINWPSANIHGNFSNIGNLTQPVLSPIDPAQ